MKMVKVKMKKKKMVKIKINMEKKHSVKMKIDTVYNSYKE